MLKYCKDNSTGDDNMVNYVHTIIVRATFVIFVFTNDKLGSPHLAATQNILTWYILQFSHIMVEYKYKIRMSIYRYQSVKA